ncbi:hypothetical protein [Kocuria sp. UCD-OTCP]|uniref:hypothetical protein n=1 Tax=Kocuria sp. UCD-OTCP TaxID=1292021 RepID=UPI001237856D|nr:hypothetical protein [Kocuria sp. UCD-OTCP]
MLVAIDEALRDMHSDVAVFWVDGGLPEMFSMPGLEPPVVIFNSRYIEISALFRNLMMDETISSELIVESSERICLRVMSELVLRYGDPSLAAYLTSRAVVGQSIFYNTGDSVTDLEVAEKDEGYMAVWFFGLLHEMGHIATSDSHRSLIADQDPELVSENIRHHLSNFPLYSEMPKSFWFPEGDLEAGHPLQPEPLIVEIACDVFAVRKLLLSSARVAEEVGRAGVDPQVFFVEVLAMLNTISMMEICHRAVRNISIFPRDISQQQKMILNPVALAVRSSALSHELSYLLGMAYPNLQPDEAAKKWSAFHTAWLDSTQGRLEQMEVGLARAMRQLFFPWEREAGLARKLHASLREPGGVMAQLELESFCRLADDLDIDHPDVDFLRQAGKLGENGTVVYLVPWVTASDGSHAPFLLETKYGYVIFAFLGNNEVIRIYLEVSESWLPSGFSLETAAVLCNSEYELSPRLLKDVPAQYRAKAVVVVEGSPRFDRWMGELATGEIFG